MEEVHFWRGTPEQQAQRTSSRKSGQFTYFDQQLDHPDWREVAVLDFGGNQGNLLRDPNCKIHFQNYYCLDVIEDAVQEGRKLFPTAHWVHYNRYNCSFNPSGVVDMPIPQLGVPFKIILAYSVFTHTTREEMHGLVGQLRKQLAPGGTLAFTFIDPHYASWPGVYPGNNLKWRLDRIAESDPAADLAGLLEKSRDAAWCALIDKTQLHVNSNGIGSDGLQDLMTYHVFYTVEFLQQEFTYATIRPPVNNEMQHCCIIKESA